jgi:PAS domain S-box-containing protein
LGDERSFRSALEHIPDVITIYDRNLRILYINKAIVLISGRPVAEFLGRREEESWLSPECDAYIGALRDTMKTGVAHVLEAALTSATGESRLFEISTIPLAGEDGSAAEVMRVMRDLTPWKRSAGRHVGSEERYRSLFEDGPAAMLLVDPDGGGILEANQAACDFYGWPRDRLLSMRIGQLDASRGDGHRGPTTRATSPRRERLELEHRMADGSIRDVEVYAGPIRLGGGTLLLWLVHDISFRAVAERERDALASRLAHYLSTSPTITYSLVLEGGAVRWMWVSENIRELLGYTMEEALKPDWWLDHVHSEDRKAALGAIARLAETKVVSQEYRFKRKDRTLVWLHDEMRIARDGGLEIVGTLTDVSDRKDVEAELSLKGSALEAAANAIVIADRNCRICWANAAFEALTGFSRDEAMGKDLAFVVGPGERGADLYRLIWDRILSGNAWSGCIRNHKKDGESYAEEVTITPVLDNARRVSAFIVIKSDETARELARQRLEASLKEKEILLREIHDRVKNNMQLIISLLHLSMRSIADSRLLATMSNISQRLLALALVHEQFYNSSDMSRIDFALYLHQSASSLRGDFPDFPGSIVISAGNEPVSLTLDKALPAGLIASELVTNALKFAYPEGTRQGDIVVGLDRSAETIMLSVRDDGVGLPASFEPKKAESLGMILVHTLASQLGGTMQFRADRGTEAILRFPEA